MYDPTLPADSSLGKAYEYGIDVNIGTDGAPIWQPVRRALNINPQTTPITQDAQSYDDKGSPNVDVAAWSFVLNFSAYQNRSVVTGELPPELKALQLRVGDAIGENAVIGVRWYHKPADGATSDPNEAFQGKATVAPTRANTAPTGANELTNYVLTGKGYATRIANPFTGWADADTLPVVTGATPEGQPAGELATISGSGFLGATSVTIDAVEAAFTVVSGGTIVATIPDGIVAGNVPVVVTTPAGASAPYVYVAG